jgi:putative NADH-flavin reductase
MGKCEYNGPMNVTVFGANGKVGRLVVKALLARGHHVTAFVHRTCSFAESDQLRITRGDIKLNVDVEKALAGADAIISALGSWGTKSKDILSVGMTVMVPIAEEHGPKRIISLTGSAAHVEGDNWGAAAKLARFGLHVVAPKIVEDGEKHLELLRESSLDWTVLRSPVMKDTGGTTYTLNQKVPGLFETIDRHAVAEALVDQLEDTAHVHQAPHLHAA